MVDADQDPWISGSVKLRSRNTGRAGRTSTSDLNVDALRVVLSSVLLTSVVQSNYLVPKDIISSSKSGRNWDSPRVVAGNQLIRSPCAWGLGTIDQTTFINLEEPQALGRSG